MSARCPRRASCFMYLSVIAILLLSAGAGQAQEVRIFEQRAWVDALAAAPCPPDHPPALEDGTATEDLTAFTATAAADTSGACGGAAALANIATSITDSTITVEFDCTVSLAGHRYAEGGAHFLVRFSLTAPVDYTLDIQGSFAYEDTLTPYSWGVVFGEHYRVDADQPHLDVTESGSLPAGASVYTLEGDCNAVRNMRYLITDWEPEDGVTTMTGSVTLTFHDASVVAKEKASLGSLKAMYR